MQRARRGSFGQVHLRMTKLQIGYTYVENEWPKNGTPQQPDPARIFDWKIKYTRGGTPKPAHTQTYNRYSYVLNNPLKYTDPTGNRRSGGGGRSLPGVYYTGANAILSPGQSEYSPTLSAMAAGRGWNHTQLGDPSVTREAMDETGAYTRVTTTTTQICNCPTTYDPNATMEYTTSESHMEYSIDGQSAATYTGTPGGKVPENSPIFNAGIKPLFVPQQYQGTLRERFPNKWEQFQNWTNSPSDEIVTYSGKIVGKIGFNILNDGYTYLYGIGTTPDQAYDLTGRGVNRNEYSKAGFSTVMNLSPGRLLKFATADIKILNIAQYNKQFKGTWMVKGSPAARGARLVTYNQAARIVLAGSKATTKILGSIQVYNDLNQAIFEK